MRHPISEIRQVLTQLESVCEEIARKNNIPHLSGPQGHVLLFLHHREQIGVFVKDIEKELKISKSVASNLVKRMEKNGFIQIVPSKEDRRYKQLFLTEIGRQKIAPLESFHEELIQQIFRGITREEVQAAHHVISRLKENIAYYKGEHHA